MTRKQWFALLTVGLMAGLALILTAAPTLADASIIYVDADAPGPAHDGLSWTTAYTNVQDALTWTNAHTTTVYEVWVAEGVYYPDEGSGHVNNSRTETFRIDWNNAQLYGGFGGYGISETLRTQRDWVAHPTILSGDIDANDWNTDTNHIAETWNDLVGSNAYHVLYLDGVTNQPITATTTLDGFIITAGYANGTTDPNDYGGGLYCAGNDRDKAACSPTLTDVTFSGNKASNSGGGMYNYGSHFGASSPTLTNVTFSSNSAGYGGGMYNSGTSFGASSPTLTDVTFSGNLASGDGGGMYNNGSGYGTSNSTLTNVTFSGNSASGNGGGMYNYSQDCGISSPTLTNVTFSGNWAHGGGGMYNYGYYFGASSPTLTNVTFNGNWAGYGGGMSNYAYRHGASSPTLTNVTFNGNLAEYGGGMNNFAYYESESRPTLTNVTFSSNKADYQGGGMSNAAQDNSASDPTLTNVTFSGNSASSGGGMYSNGFYYGYSSPTLINVTFSGNSATDSGGGMYNYGQDGGISSPTVVNSILWGNTAVISGSQIFNSSATPTISYSDVQGGCPTDAACGSGMLDSDPLFTAPITATAAPTTTGNYRLTVGSRAINAGNNLGIAVATDRDGNPRIVGGVVDMGAYEAPLDYTLTVNVTGPASGMVNTTYPFTATASPITATMPITYTWMPEPNSGQSTTNATYSWATDGAKTITVTVTNAVGTVTDTHVIVVYVPLNSVTVAGPTSGMVNTTYPFTATVSPITATTSITYTWTPAPDSGQGTANATYSWATDGAKTITVTVTNAGGTVTDTYAIVVVYVPLNSVTLAGPTSGMVNTTYPFTATVSPITATTPITYTWTPAPDSGQGTANATYSWATGGVKAITVTAQNPANTVADTYSLTIFYSVYLPVVLR